MRALIQRVASARVLVGPDVVAQIGRGLVVLLGVGHTDGEQQVTYLAGKIANLRIFEDPQGKTNLSALDVQAQALVVSQFTLYADVQKGRRPSFVDAASPEHAQPLIGLFADRLKTLGLPTQTGAFGARMLVDIQNDGPFTIWLEKAAP